MTYFKHIRWISFLILLAIFNFSCRRPPAKKLISGKKRVQQLDFEYLSTKTKLKFKDGDNNISATANIRIKKDSIIWFVVSPGLGIKAATGCITQDSVILVNRIQKEYTKYSFDELSKKLNFPLNYKLLQAALLGHLIKVPERNDVITQGDNYIILNQEIGHLTMQSRIHEKKMVLEKVFFRDSLNNTLLLDYDDFQQVEETAFPFKNLLTLSYQNGQKRMNMSLDFKHSKVSKSTEKLSFPISIPSKYKERR